MKITLLYDGNCVLCRQSNRLVSRLDWLNRTQSFDAQMVHEQYPNLDYTDLMGAIHVITTDEQVLVGFFSVRYLARSLPLLWPLSPLLYLPGMNWLGPKIYGWIARRRYTINRLVGAPTCEDGSCKIH